MPPATKIEAFHPAAGTVLTFGSDELGGVNGTIVDVRKLKDSNGASVIGLLVKVTMKGC